MKEQIKELRIKIDGLYQLTKELKTIDRKPEPLTIEMVSSKQIEDAAHSLIYAKAWLGKCLGELGAESPYKSGYKTVSDIEPTADKVNSNFTKDAGIWHNLISKSHIGKVDWLRCSIEDIIQEIIKLDLKGSRELAIARTNSYTHLCEARFALGFELERIKEENK